MGAVLDPSLLATMSDEELARTLRVDVGTLVDVAKTIAQSPSSTIEPAPNRSDAPGRRAIEGLGAEHRQIREGLSFEKTIGEGGMGIVRLATQRSLGRHVAVKTLREGAKSEQATLRLLREAWVTGSLEHPNIVPVYDLGLDDQGSPIIILKKIEGVEWAALIAKKELEDNLRILVQLCNAVSLAHARGVLHRDLKPENVMIGSFGEVYLVDWGIAVSLRADPTGRLPLASEAKEIAGTPCYMAPEMLGALGTLTERTDVYLLGAILYEILAKAPPHQGSFRQIVASVLLSEPKLPPETPRELAEIVRRAMAREPESRFASADELRERLEWYLRHRGSLALSQLASEKLREVRELVANDGERERVYRLLAEARFGFRQALDQSPDNEGARQGLREAIEAVVGFELTRGKSDAASVALAELADPAPGLEQQVKEALARDEAEQKRLRAIEASYDLRIGRRTRLAVGLILGSVWIVAPLYAGLYFDRVCAWFGARPMHVMYAWNVVLVAMAVALRAWGKESLTKTELNRALGRFLGVVFGGQIAVELVCDVRHIDTTTALLLHFGVWIMGSAVTALIIDRRFMPTVLAYGAALVGALLSPQWVWFWIAGGHTFLLANAFVAWTTREDKLGQIVGGVSDAIHARRSSRHVQSPNDL